MTKKSYGKNEDIISEAFVTVSLTIENVGDYDGAEVYQVYISFPEYYKVLRYFEKRFIREGRHIDSTFTLRKKELSIWDTENKEWMIPSGKYTLHIGASSRDIRHSSDFTLYPF